ncbi:hypothetical protein RF55_9060 [Lasius niger]|uniref:Uncharacterized protein n=1 Tax=Lasius niger TaxID=67767 RepID=A0A0J7KLL6_LASNI|nr:hypothetical protein RF55_9060 [Lasius niger]
MERTRRRGEASRSRGRSPRTKNRSYTTMMKDKKKEDLLSPQGKSRSLSDRRENSTVPGVLPSSSDVGPAFSLPTGEERKSDIVVEEVEREEEELLEMATVDCLTFS